MARTVACCGMVALLALAAAVGTTDAHEQMESTATVAEAAVDQPAQAKSGGSDAENIAAALLRGLRGGAAGGPSAALGVFVARNYKKMAQTILPLLVGFKATGLLVAAMAITKFILLKALFLSTTALLVAAIMALKKFLSSASQPHDAPAVYTYQHQDMSHLPYLHSAAAEYMDASQASMQMPQVTYIGGSYGLQSIPYAATGGALSQGLGQGLGDDAQGLYSSHSGSVAALSQLQQLQQLQQQALLAQQLGNATTQQQQQQQQQAGQLLQLSRRRLSAPQGVTASSPYPYRPNRPEARPA